MQTLKLDENNNLVLSRGELVVIDGIDACAQDTKTRIGLVRGENPYDITQGADYYNELLGKMGGTEYIREEVRKRILDNEEIVGIKLMTIEEDHANQQTTVTANIATIYGDIEL